MFFSQFSLDSPDPEDEQCDSPSGIVSIFNFNSISFLIPSLIFWFSLRHSFNFQFELNFYFDLNFNLPILPQARWARDTLILAKSVTRSSQVLASWGRLGHKVFQNCSYICFWSLTLEYFSVLSKTQMCRMKSTVVLFKKLVGGARNFAVVQ